MGDLKMYLKVNFWKASASPILIATTVIHKMLLK